MKESSSQRFGNPSTPFNMIYPGSFIELLECPGSKFNTLVKIIEGGWTRMHGKHSFKCLKKRNSDNDDNDSSDDSSDDDGPQIIDPTSAVALDLGREKRDVNANYLLRFSETD